MLQKEYFFDFLKSFGIFNLLQVLLMVFLAFWGVKLGVISGFAAGAAASYIIVFYYSTFFIYYLLFIVFKRKAFWVISFLFLAIILVNYGIRGIDFVVKRDVPILAYSAIVLLFFYLHSFNYQQNKNNRVLS